MELLYAEAHAQIARLVSIEEVQELLVLFQRVADELAWQPGDWLVSPPEHLLHFAALENGLLAGGAQVVMPDGSGQLPYRHVWPEVNLADAEQTAHVTILALAPQFRGHSRLFWPLCVEVWRTCVAEGIHAIVLEATPPMLERYRRIGFPLEVIGDLRMHWGEDCYLCRTPISTVAGMLVMRAVRSPIYRAFVAQAMRSIANRGCAPLQALA